MKEVIVIANQSKNIIKKMKCTTDGWHKQCPCLLD